TASNANRIDASAAFVNGRLIRPLSIIRTGAEERVFTSTTFQWLFGNCPSIVSGENTGRHTCRYRGDEGEGATLRTTFFAYKTKRQLYLSGFLVELTLLAPFLDYPIRLQQHVRRNR